MNPNLRVIASVLLVILTGCCATTASKRSIVGTYSSNFVPQPAGRTLVYVLTLDADGRYYAWWREYTADGVRVMDSSLHAEGYQIQEASRGTWSLSSDRL